MEDEFIYNENVSYIPDTRTDRCFWCKGSNGIVGGHNVGNHLPVCKTCIDLAVKLLPEKCHHYYFYIKKAQMEFDL